MSLSITLAQKFSKIGEDDVSDGIIAILRKLLAHAISTLEKDSDFMSLSKDDEIEAIAHYISSFCASLEDVDIVINEIKELMKKKGKAENCHNISDKQLRVLCHYHHCHEDVVEVLEEIKQQDV